MIYKIRKLVLLLSFFVITVVIPYKLLNVDMRQYTNFGQDIVYNYNPNNLTNSVLPFSYYIFQIGFNKAGTRSIYDLFHKNGIPAIHSRLWPVRPNFDDLRQMKCKAHIKNCMQYQYERKRPILGPYANHIRYYGDFVVFAERDVFEDAKHAMYIPWYPLLAEQYNSKFILNIRNVNHWIKSRYFHDQHLFLSKKLLNLNSTNENIEDDKFVIIFWKEWWYRYHCDVFKYFHDRNITHNLIVFDIENNSFDLLVDFFNDILVHVKHSQNHRGKTEQNTVVENQWNKIIQHFDWLLLNDKEDGFQNEYERIVDQCINTFNYNDINYALFPMQ